MDITLINILIISFIIPILKSRKIGKKLILKIYAIFMIYSSLIIVIYRFNTIKRDINSLNLYKCILMVLISIVIYMVDLLCVNIVKNDAIILDFKYYFKGKVNDIKFLISVFITIMEELVFRMWLLAIKDKMYLYLIISSVCFGLVHIFFSKYDCISKIILGMILGIIYIYTENIIYSIIMHLFYNYLVLKIKE